MQVGVQVVGALGGGVLVVPHPVHETVDHQVRVAHRNGVGPHGGDLPLAGRVVGDAVGLAVVEVQLEVVEAGQLQVEARAEQVVLVAVLATLVGGGQQHVADGAEFQLPVEQLAEGQSRGDLTVVGVLAQVRVFLAVVVDLVDEDEQVAEGPAAGVLEGEGLLDFRVDLEILAIQIGQAVVLPQQWAVGQRVAGSQQAAGEHQGGKGTVHRGRGSRSRSFYLRRKCLIGRACLPGQARRQSFETPGRARDYRGNASFFKRLCEVRRRPPEAGRVTETARRWRRFEGPGRRHVTSAGESTRPSSRPAPPFVRSEGEGSTPGGGGATSVPLAAACSATGPPPKMTLTRHWGEPRNVGEWSPELGKNWVEKWGIPRPAIRQSLNGRAANSIACAITTRSRQWTSRPADGPFTLALQASRRSPKGRYR
ncbi:hypothetical protein D3C84_491270 [compost metagenome]